MSNKKNDKKAGKVEKGSKGKKAPKIESAADALKAVLQREEPTPEAILGAADRVLADKSATPKEIKKAKAARKAAKGALKGVTPPTPTVFVTPEDKKRFRHEANPGESMEDWLERRTPTALEVDPVVEAAKASLAKKKAAREAGTDPNSLADPGDRLKSEPVDDETTAAEAAALADKKKAKKAKDAPAEEEFVAPAEAVELNGNGQYIIHDLEKGGPRGFTRATTYIDCLEERSLLEKWGRRVVLLGVAKAELDPSLSSIAGPAHHAYEHYSAELARIDKKDRKGKLEIGERGDLEAAALSEFNSTLNDLAELAFVTGDGEVKANAGTNLHGLAELYDRAILAGSKEPEKALPADITPSDLADIRAYAAEMKRQGIEVVAAEGMVVLDDLHVAGRYDRLVRFLPEGATRRVLAIGDVKTGRVDFGAGKIGMQVLVYATGKGYDPANPTERVDLKASKNVGLLIHLPQGKATCTIYEIDLKLAAKGLALAGQVRAWRNEGKKVFDVKRPLTPPTERNIA